LLQSSEATAAGIIAQESGWIGKDQTFSRSKHLLNRYALCSARANHDFLRGFAYCWLDVIKPMALTRNVGQVHPHLISDFGIPIEARAAQMLFSEVNSGIGSMCDAQQEHVPSLLSQCLKWLKGPLKSLCFDQGLGVSA